MRNVIVIVFCAIVFSACGTSQKSTQGSGNTSKWRSLTGRRQSHNLQPNHGGNPAIW